MRSTGRGYETTIMEDRIVQIVRYGYMVVLGKRVRILHREGVLLMANGYTHVNLLGIRDSYNTWVL